MKVLRFAIVALGVAGMPAIANAQACLGTPIGTGQFGIEGAIGLGDGYKSYGGGVAANLVGPFAFAGGVSISKPDGGGDNLTSLQAQGAYEVTSGSLVSACPVVGLGYSRFSTQFLGEDINANQLIVPIGVGLGTTLPAGTVDVTLYAVPQFMWFRTSASAMGESESDTANEFGLSTGLRFSGSRVYAGAGMSLTTIEDSDPLFTFSLGMIVGSRR